jgi:hypothetical protein
MPKYISIFINDLSPDEPIPFNVYAQIKGKKDMILFIRAGVSIPAERLQELAYNENLSFFISPSDLSTYKTYFTSKARKLSPETPENVIEAGIEQMLHQDHSDEILVFGPTRKINVRTAFLASAAVALVEVYAGARESIALALGAVTAYIIFIVFIFIAKSKMLEQTLPRKRPPVEPVKKAGMLLCPHCTRIVPPGSSECRTCGGRLIVPELNPGKVVPEPAPVEEKTPEPSSA